MTPKETAKELFYKYCYAIRENEGDDGCFKNTIKAKKCVLLELEEIKFVYDALFYAIDKSIFDKYLYEVKQEIEKL